jgi:hypothetical protein
MRIILLSVVVLSDSPTPRRSAHGGGKLPTVQTLLLVGVGKASAKLIGAGSGVKLPTVQVRNMYCI